jgi:RNA polymerase sigma factor (sigma-70 family)
VPERSARRSRPGRDADQAVAVFYDAHCRAVNSVATLLVNDVAGAQEAVEAAFVALHGAWRYLQDSDKALLYLLRAVVRRARSRRAGHRGLPGRRPGMPPAGQPAASSPEALLVAAFRALPARQREALVLRYYAELPVTQVAYAMGIPISAAGSHLESGMARLQAVLERRDAVLTQHPAARQAGG